MNTNYVPPKDAAKILGVHWQTLRNWDKAGLIQTIRSEGGKRFYNVKKYMEDNGIKQKNVINEIFATVEFHL